MTIRAVNVSIQKNRTLALPLTGLEPVLLLPLDLLSVIPTTEPTRSVTNECINVECKPTKLFIAEKIIIIEKNSHN